MYKVFGYGLEDIPYINRLKRRVFCAITLTILSLNIFISFSLNLRNLAKTKNTLLDEEADLKIKYQKLEK